MPRHQPLVLPLGEGYPLALLAEALGEPERIGLLPPIPYGWSGSGLRVSPPLLEALLENLVNSLREDGFSRLYVLTPQNTEIQLGAAQIRLPHPSQHNAATLSLLPMSATEKVIVIPVGHIEQHGFHLPLSTDTVIISAIAQRTAQAVPQQAFALPVMPYGVSTHRQNFAGTLNCGGRAFEDFWLGVVDVLVSCGCDQIYFINGHGGNHSFLVNVIKYAGERYPRIFCATSWLYLSGPEGIAALQAHRQSAPGGMGHACELETSLMLYLQPESVHLERAVDETDFITTPNYTMDWVEGGALIANPSWADDTRTGAYGAGSLGTAEKGRLWLEAAVHEKISHVSEIQIQHRQREARRRSGFGLWGKAS